MSNDGGRINYDITTSVRVKQVQFDSAAWPTCDPKAILLKRKFECHMLPTRCHEVNEDAIRQICPEEGIHHQKKG
jgi:hypothetical protein